MGLCKTLKKNIEGRVLTDHFSQHIYSVDASIYEVKPKVVVVPKTKQDIVTTIELAHEYHVPITSRGAATSLTGAALGEGIVIDYSTFYNRILDISVEDKLVTCQVGAVQDELNQKLRPYGLMLGADTSSSRRATIGGMIGNNSSGAHSLHYGKMSDYIEKLDCFFSNAKACTLARISKDEYKQKLKLKNHEGEIYRLIETLRNSLGNDELKKFPGECKNVDGYNLPSILSPFPINLCELLAGSEGSLGVITEATLRLVEVPKTTGLIILFYDDIYSAFDDVPSLLNYTPYSLEIIDKNVIEIGIQSKALKADISWIKGSPQAIIALELQGSSEKEIADQLYHLKNKFTQSHLLISKAEQASFWSFRKLSLGLILSKRTYERAYAFIEDFSIPPKHLGAYFKKFYALMERYDRKGGLYGHVGSGCLHFRPFFNLSSPEDVRIMEKISFETTQLLKEHQGALSGEHGDGRIRSWLLKDFFGDKVYDSFKQIKKVFDPENIFNPGVIVNPKPFKHSLRALPSKKPIKIETFLNFKQEGGFSLAVDLCNGNALCRKNDGLMCPTFQATQDETQSTRGRAQSLRAIIHERLSLENLQDKKLYEILDYCLECKGCKSECPSHVDMAKIKSEFLYQYYQKHKSSFRRYLFGHTPKLLSKAQHIPHFILEGLFKLPFQAELLKLIGIDAKTPLPILSKRPFNQTYTPKHVQSANTVALFVDTYSKFLSPEIPLHAMKVLKALGKEVIILPWKCCGRTYISKGYLEEAKSLIQDLIETYQPIISKGIPIIGLEPSCTFTLKDNIGDFFPEYANFFDESTYTLENYLLKYESNKISKHFDLTAEDQKIMVHTHCHQKSSEGNLSTEKILKNIHGIDVKTLNSGCCGMAGSFGYETEHSKLSEKIFEHSVQKHLTIPHNLLIANGFSCRHRLKHSNSSPTEHIASFLASLI